MAHKPHKETSIFINEVSSHQRRYHKVLELTRSTTKAAGVMLLGAIVALIVANTAAHGAFTEFSALPKCPSGSVRRTRRCRWLTLSM